MAAAAVAQAHGQAPAAAAAAAAAVVRMPEAVEHGQAAGMEALPLLLLDFAKERDPDVARSGHERRGWVGGQQCQNHYHHQQQQQQQQ